MIKQANFKLPATFFTKVLKDYRDWKYAWIREILQNSIDAKSTKIDITATDEGNGIFAFTVKDNGKGMSMQVLEDCFMALGGSEKDEGDTGGFGVASMMIAQSHVDYTIRSHNYICQGSKGSYTVEDDQEFLKGVEITVRMSQESFNNTYQDPISVMRNNLSRWSNYSFVKGVEITFNGENYSTKNRKFDFTLESEIGTMTFSDSKDDYYSNRSILFVRINKQAMFSVETYHEENGMPFEGVLDLDGASIDMLTSNRDGLSGDKSRVVSNILQELSKERTKYTLGNMNEFVLNENMIEQIESMEFQPDCSAKETNSEEKEGVKVKSEKYDDGSEQVISKGIFQKQKEKFETQKTKIVDRLKRIKNEYYPENFNIKYDLSGNNLSEMSDLIKNLNQKRYQKIAWTWKVMVESALDALIISQPYYYQKVNDVYFMDRKPIKIGFVFKSTTEGLCVQNKNEIIVYINPLLAYEFDLEEIQDVAFHELAHIEYNSHNESFCSQESLIRRTWRKYYKLSDLKYDIKNSHREMV